MSKVTRLLLQTVEQGNSRQPMKNGVKAQAENHLTFYDIQRAIY
jgi:hypothetical protein